MAKVTQVSSEYFGFSYQLSFHQVLNTHHYHPELEQQIH
jgi:hypothetical protein